MALTPENKVKRRVVAYLDNAGAYYFFPATGGYGKSGVPDVIACVNGRFVGIECKSGTNKPTALQRRNLDQIGHAGGYAIVVNETNVDDLPDLLNTITKEEPHD